MPPLLCRFPRLLRLFLPSSLHPSPSLPKPSAASLRPAYMTIATLVECPLSPLPSDAVDFRRAWCSFARSPDIPPLVQKLMIEVKSLETELGEKLVFGGPRGGLQGRAKAAEEHMHRAFYGYLPKGEEKLQFYSARQIACRILGSKDYLCENCWLPLIDCICTKVERLSLWQGVKLWLYMHPKDFLRKNNSGKLLWQVFGPDSVQLCIFGIQEHENIMWNALEKSGQKSAWYLYPEQSSSDLHVADILVPEDIADQQVTVEVYPTYNFILIDGTWSNSKAMINRLQDRAKITWPEKHINSVSLSLDKLSVLHNLRPQPSLDRTCTAAATAQLLRELDLRNELRAHKLSDAADALENALEYLLHALTTRRERMGRAGNRSRRFH